MIDRFSSTCILPVICAFTSTAAEFTRPLGVFQTGAAHSNRGRDLSVPRISGSFVCMRHHLLRYTELRLQSNFQIRLRLTFLRIFSKSGWLDCCLELKFPDRSLFKAILNSFPDLFPENCCFLITMLDYLFIFILLWG